MRQKKKFEHRYPYRIVYLSQRGKYHVLDFMAKSDAEAITRLNQMKKWAWNEWAVYQWRYMGCRRHRWLRLYPPKKR